MARFALDHNYPEPLLMLASEDTSVDLVSIERIDERLTEFDDWQILLALHHHEDEWDGMITNDTSMLGQPVEMAVLTFTQLTLVAPSGVGHDPVRSTGLVMAHIERIAAQTTPRKPQIWKIGERTGSGDHPERYVKQVAKREGVDPLDVLRDATPAREVLDSDPLDS